MTIHNTYILIQQGLSESLAGRFEMLCLPHWSLAEMRAAFGFTPEQFLFYGGYPGAAPFVGDPGRWVRYIRDALIETTIARDVLLLSRVDKPALLRRLFELGCRYSGQVLSYTKMLGQLQDAGNTVTLAHYLDLLAAAGMLAEIPEYAGLANAAAAGAGEIFYWRERNREVDFVIRAGRMLTAIEVKSGRAREFLPGIAAFATAFRPNRILLVDGRPPGVSGQCGGAKGGGTYDCVDVQFRSPRRQRRRIP